MNNLEFNLYTKEGWLNVEDLMNSKYNFISMIGARGIGKTYGVLEYFIKHPDNQFVYMRRQQTELDIVGKEGLSPFNQLNKDLKTHYVLQPVNKYMSGVYIGKPDDEGIYKPQGNMKGFICALSTVSHLRSLSLPDVDYLFYDEFIPESTARPIKDEAIAFLNAIETIGRNRELTGQKPLKVIMAANSNNVANPMFTGLGIVDDVVRMQEEGKEVLYIKDMDCLVLNILGSPISEKKLNTSLYRFASRTNFQDMAIKNKFVGLDTSLVTSFDIKGFSLRFSINGMYFYRKNNKYYVTTHKSGSLPKNLEFGSGEQDIKSFRFSHMFLVDLYLNNMIYFENYSLLVKFQNIFTC